jgi:hypothetical protein
VNDIDRFIMCALGVTCELSMFFIPSAAATALRDRRLGAVVAACLLYPALFAFAILSALGWASTNIDAVTQAKAERQSPAILDAQRRLDTLSASRADECRRRGDRCRALESEEKAALDALGAIRASQAAGADVQAATATKLALWLSAGVLRPTSDDVGLLRILLLSTLPNAGGLLLLLARC